MTRPAVIFFVAIFLPSLVLGWLALRTAGEQRVVLERQEADLRQSETDALAAAVERAVREDLERFVDRVRTLVGEHGAPAVAENFGERLAATGESPGIPFAVAPSGAIVFPRPGAVRPGEPAAQFLQQNRAFLSNTAEAEIYQAAPAPRSKEVAEKSADRAAPRAENTKRQTLPAQVGSNLLKKTETLKAAQEQTSEVLPAVSDFQSATAGRAQGSLARFVDNDLQVLFWTRPDPAADWLFGVMLGPPELSRLAAAALPDNPGGVDLAVLDDKGKPVARQPGDFTADWKRPFVASEVGEILPHWEVALYLSNPDALASSARLVSLTVIFLIALALAAILAGGYFVAADTRRQLALAQKKTDFVSNVSHELKTPLTSIRMFADLLADGKVPDAAKQSRYLRIISTESERLTRLVNNVLDFARLERHRKVYEMREVDVHALMDRLWEAESVRLREAGFALEWDAAPGPYTVVCDADGVAQILVNLLANAEKYATRRREITLRSAWDGETLTAEVLDRGPGIPRGLEEKIFEAFFRADDSLASGVQGSGLGLALARRIARDHGGDLTARPRDGGGTVFSLRLPRRPPIHP